MLTKELTLPWYHVVLVAFAAMTAAQYLIFYKYVAIVGTILISKLK